MSKQLLPEMVSLSLSLWQRLTTPSSRLHEPHRRRKAQLAAAAHLMLMPSGFIVLLIARLIVPDTLFQNQNTAFSIILSTTVLLLIGYSLSRLGYYQWAAVFSGLVTSCYLFIRFTLYKDPISDYLLFYLIFPLIGTSLFLSFRAVIALTVFDLVAILLLPGLNGRSSLADLFIGPFIFVTASALLTLMVAHFRTALEYDREVELVRREDHLRLITDNMLDLIVQIGLDGSLQYVSPAVKDMLGYTPEMLIGEPLAAWVQRLHPDDLQPTRRLFERLAQGKTVKSPYTIELRCKHADGHYVWLEGLGNMLTRREGQTAGFILIVRDITERIKAQETVRQTHQQLEMAYAMQHRLIEQTPVGIQVFDTNGICTDVNQAQLDIFGVSNRDQLIGKFNIFADAMAASVGTQQGLRRALNGETVHLSEVFFDFVHADPRYTARNGQRVLSVSFFPLYNAEGKIVNVVALNQDITARKRAEDQKIELAIERERIKLLQRFIGDLAHDIRTPLATINTSLYLLMRANLPEKRETHQHIIESQVLRLEKVVEDLTNASRLEDEAFAYTFRPALLNQIVEDVANDFHDAVADKRHTLTVQCDREVESILTDRSQLKQALKYILENAINYTPEGGQIYLTTYRKARQVCVEIRDTGMGIEANNLNYIFEPFYRVDKSRGDSGGAGLGLTVARRIVKAHGGEITVESKIGVGSTFCVWLPITINWS